ncbi:MBL fold metallo-hydrolase [Miniphocaeibacter massiliensis]|uniref:MBL fold metallo-hydrolase n=1 Tax=Miniphocaeibacter massiliensis TaxID=2041841 RepID=UPI000C1C2F33|nr:MBL fold metallo-hydrolase [Miniphocaeibacter massiliensis]
MNIQVIASSSKGNCYKIDDGDTSLLIECGISYKEIQEALNFKISSIKACLITHEHKDHSKAYKDLLNKGIRLVMSKGTKEALGITENTVKLIKAKESIKIGSFNIMAFDTVHDVAEPIGFLIESNKTGERLVFFTDTIYSRYTFKNIDYYMVECNYVKKFLDDKDINSTWRNRVVKSHMSLETLLQFLASTDLERTKKIYITHLSDTNSDERYIKTEIQKAIGKVIEIC